MWTQIGLLLQSDPGPHGLPVCKNMFEKFARIFNRRHKQTTFSDAVFLGALRVKETLNQFHTVCYCTITLEAPQQVVKLAVARFSVNSVRRYNI